MNKINAQAELFAIRVMDSARIGVKRCNDNPSRSCIINHVSKAVHRLDYSKQYKDDDGRMIVYVTDALCSELGIEN